MKKNKKGSIKIPQFEAALLALKVQIEEIITPNTYVREAIGYKDGKRMVWDSKGKCTQNKKRRPEYNLTFNNQIP